MHRERHDLVSEHRMIRQKLARGRGYPNELQARQVIEDEAYKIGKARLSETLNVSERYLRLVLNGERSPVHLSFLNYFGWSKVYEVAPEDDI